MPPSALSQALLELHEAAAMASPALCREAMLATLRRHVAFDSAVWGVGAQEPLRVFSISSLDFPDTWLARYPAWQDQDRLRAAAAAQAGRAVRNEDLGPIEQHWASPVHLGYNRPAGIERAVAIAALDPATQVGELMMLFRRDRDRPFSDADCRLIEDCWPHLLAAARRRMTSGFRRIAEQPGDCHALVDDGGLVHASGLGFGIAMQRAFPDWCGPLIPEPLSALVARGGGVRRGTLLFEVERGTTRHLLLVSAADRAYLTAAEQRAARLYARGMTARAVAAELGLSERTVRNQLAAAYQKLGVSSRAELIRQFAQGPSDSHD